VAVGHQIQNSSKRLVDLVHVAEYFLPKVTVMESNSGAVRANPFNEDFRFFRCIFMLLGALTSLSFLHVLMA